jgi:hypothetical protein
MVPGGKEISGEMQEPLFSPELQGKKVSVPM